MSMSKLHPLLPLFSRHPKAKLCTGTRILLQFSRESSLNQTMSVSYIMWKGIYSNACWEYALQLGDLGASLTRYMLPMEQNCSYPYFRAFCSSWMKHHYLKTYKTKIRTPDSNSFLASVYTSTTAINGSKTVVLFGNEPVINNSL